MKKIIAATLAIITMLSMTVCANDRVVIEDVRLKDGLICVTTERGSEMEALFTYKLMKEDDTQSEADNLYWFSQELVKGTAKDELKVEIPDIKKETIRGSGKYTIYVRLGDERDSHTFEYADSIDVNVFVLNLKAKDALVTDETKAWEQLLPVMKASENAGELFSVGIDRAAFMTVSEDVQKESMNLLHANGLATLEADNIPETLSNCYGLAVYNTGNKEYGTKLLNPDYGEKVINSDVREAATTIMADRYNTVAEFKSGFLLAYGLETVKHATGNNMGETLSDFKNITGQCAVNINKVNSISDPVKRYEAYDAIVLACDTQTVTTASQLDSILDAAYISATARPGGGIGGAANRTNTSTFVTPVSPAPDSSTSATTDKASIIFRDLPDTHWSAQAVSWLKNKNVVGGNENGDFEPERFVTREEFTKMLVVICGLNTSDHASRFKDVESGQWYEPYIAAAVENGIVNGVSADRFGVGENISRQDMAVMTARALRTKGIKAVKVKEYTQFKDNTQISEYAHWDIVELFEAGIISGKTTEIFDPRGNATRAEAAKIIYEAFKGGE